MVSGLYIAAVIQDNQPEQTEQTFNAKLRYRLAKQFCQAAPGPCTNTIAGYARQLLRHSASVLGRKIVALPLNIGENLHADSEGQTFWHFSM